jgi:hypothetical protein
MITIIVTVIIMMMIIIIIIKLFNIHVLSQQIQGQLQKEHSVDTVNYNTNKSIKTTATRQV